MPIIPYIVEDGICNVRISIGSEVVGNQRIDEIRGAGRASPFLSL